MAYKSRYADKSPTKDLDRPIMGNASRMEDGVHIVTIKDITKTSTSSGIDTVTLELVNGVGDAHTATIFLYRHRSKEFSGIFKKLLSAALHESIDVIKEIITLVELEDWLVLDYLLGREIKIKLTSSAGYKIKRSKKGYTFNNATYYETVGEARSAAKSKGLTPSYTNITDIFIAGETNECTDQSRDTTKDTKAPIQKTTKTNRSSFMGHRRTKSVSTKKRFI